MPSCEFWSTQDRQVHQPLQSSSILRELAEPDARQCLLRTRRSNPTTTRKDQEKAINQRRLQHCKQAAQYQQADEPDTRLAVVIFCLEFPVDGHGDKRFGDGEHSRTSLLGKSVETVEIEETLSVKKVPPHDKIHHRGAVHGNGHLGGLNPTIHGPG